MSKAVIAAPVDTSKSQLGFWIYLMTDCVLFASLFAVYAVLHRNTFGGPAGYQIFSMPYVLTETMALLTSSFTCGLAVLSAKQNKVNATLNWLGVTFILGITFLAMELTEFSKLIHDGNSWRRSGFLSSYFTLVGTHGLHITIGLIWMLVLGIRLYNRGFTPTLQKRLALFSLFWHFLDLIWIFIFSIVYLFGAARI
jgi:cytochrome o ubiquinol oxidase subunit 3